MARPSKIGQLPAALRNELNQRLEDGHQAKNLIPWLNTRAEAHAKSSSSSSDPDSDPVQFTAITEQNLSDWRHGGFLEWQLLAGIHEASARLGEASGDLAEVDLNANQFLTLLKARLAANLLAWDGSPGSDHLHNMNILLRLIKGVLTMRRSEQHDERRDLDRERLELTRETRTRRPSVPKAPKTAATAPPAPTLNPTPAAQIAQPPPLPAWVQRAAAVPTETQAPVASAAQQSTAAMHTATVASPGFTTPPAQSNTTAAPATAPNQPAAPTTAQPAPAQKPAVGQRPVNSNPYRLNLLR